MKTALEAISAFQAEVREDHATSPTETLAEKLDEQQMEKIGTS